MSSRDVRDIIVMLCAFMILAGSAAILLVKM
jgi:hypothetical protein